MEALGKNDIKIVDDEVGNQLYNPVAEIPKESHD